ncbi:hypothetical protein MYXE_00910 [Mycobacterium xenopi]|uniref:SGNH domain-containing protein n=1 Tax=Mycobacterium xenopi TaxID=1789 RepID=A0AAD1LZ17_MYCXE|nr:hypothetical protein MYXE_00910 [Mycobacterium xenopi]
MALTAGLWRRLPAPGAAITGWAGLVLILLSCTLVGPTTPYPGSAALLPVLGTALVIGAGCADGRFGAGRLLARSPMRAIGRVSYSWYLWHWPVLLLAAPLLGHPLGLAAGWSRRRVRCAGGADLVSGGKPVAVRRADSALAGAQPGPRRGGHRGRDLRRRGAAGGGAHPGRARRAATALAITAAPDPAGPHRYHTAVQHAFAQVQAALAASADLTAVPSNLNPPLADAAAEPLAMFSTGCLNKVIDRQPRVCASGDTASATTVALVGDSDATMWAPAFQQVAAQRHWRLETLAKAACPPMNLPIINPHLRRKYTECGQWQAQLLPRLRAEHPKLVVVSMWRGYSPGYGVTSYDRAWIDSLTVLVRQLRGTGAQVLVLGPIPDPHTVVPICLSGHLEDANACAPARSAAVNDAGIAAEAAATKAAGGHYADVTALFCTAKRCPAIVGNTLVYPDINDATHITFEYSRLLAPAMGALTDHALAHP